ncbi:MAG: T9SS type A sorting domain-containing protein [Candidatus Neomarinimicrobiota bacterium]
MGPALDSLEIFNNGTINLDDNYIGTDIRIMAIDNYAVTQITISFSGLVNVEGFDITIDFDSNSDNLLYMDTTIIFDSNIPSDNYESVQVSLRDFHDNEKVYDIDQLHDLDLYQQVGIINTLSNNSFEISPRTFHLKQNYPNPFNPNTEIGYSIPEDTFVSITIYNVQGRLVKTLVNQNQDAGIYLTNWDAKNKQGVLVPAGMYFYSIQAEDFTQTKKMVLLK